MRSIKTDVAIMGSGLSGMAAALRAQKAGLSVAVFEKRPFQGGSVSNTPIIVQVTRPGREYQEKAFNTYMDYTNWSGNPHVVRTWIRYAAQIPKYVNQELGIPFAGGIMTELEDMGVKPAYGGSFDKGMNIGDYYLLKGIGQGHGAAVICKKAKDLFVKNGGQFFVNMPITKLLKEGDRVVGAMAYDKAADEEVKIEAKAVVVACGGAINNAQMLKEELDVTYTDKNASGDGNMVPLNFSNGQMDGDGIKAVWDIGGAHGKLWMGTGTNIPNPGTAGDNCPWMQPTMLMTLVEQPYLTVNERGERFISENFADNHMVKFTTFYNQPGKRGFLIFDANTAKKIEEQGVDNFYFIFDNLKIPNLEGQFRKCMELGNTHVFVADTIDEIADHFGIEKEGLKETIERYNGYCDDGYDDEFFVKKDFLYPVREPKFFAIQPVISGYSTVGGVRINGKCEVLDTDMRPIKGLYAGGDICLTEMHGATPYGCTSVSTFAFATGFAIGDQLAETLK